MNFNFERIKDKRNSVVHFQPFAPFVSLCCRRRMSSDEGGGGGMEEGMEKI